MGFLPSFWRRVRQAITLPVIGYVILLGFTVYSLYRVQKLGLEGRDAISNNIKEDCVDSRGDRAFRDQDAAVIKIYKDFKTGKLSQEEVSDKFIETYEEALKQAGPVPDCILDK